MLFDDTQHCAAHDPWHGSSQFFFRRQKRPVNLLLEVYRQPDRLLSPGDFCHVASLVLHKTARTFKLESASKRSVRALDSRPAGPCVP